MLLVDGEVRGWGHEKCSVPVRGDGTGEFEYETYTLGCMARVNIGICYMMLDDLKRGGGRQTFV
jgi:hypothetical protein